MMGDKNEEMPMYEMGYTRTRNWNIFQQCDTNNDEKISIDELANFVASHENECSFIPRRILNKIHQMADLNKDEHLNFQEFDELLNNKDLQYKLNKYISSYIHYLIPQPEQGVSGPFSSRSLKISGEEEPNLCDEYSCCPPPVFMFLITILEAALFITDEITQEGSSLTASGITGKYLLYDPRKKKEAWRFVTYMFVHIGLAHIIVNLIVQLLLGIPLEMVNKWWRVLTIYFLGGIAGSLAHSIIDGNVRLGGASGGVYALLTAHLAQVIMNWDSLKYPLCQFVIFGIIISADLGSAAYHRYYLNEINEIGVTCHLGGALAGLLVGIYILRNVHITTLEKYIWWGALTLYILLMSGAIVATIFL